jgi:hypothetical protein
MRNVGIIMLLNFPNDGNTCDFRGRELIHKLYAPNLGPI